MPRIVKVALWVLRISVAGWLLGMVVLLLLFRLVGEKNLTTGFLLFLPPYSWFLPLIVLVPAALMISRSWLVLLVGGSALLFWLGFGYQLRLPQWERFSGRRSPDWLVVLTNNRGNSANQSLKPFKNAVRPDVVVFQEATGRARFYLQDPGYSEFTAGENMGEFTLLSRFPIVARELLSFPMAGSDESIPFAARFEISWNDRPVAVYAVRLPTPRYLLIALHRGAFLYGLTGIRGTPHAEPRRQYQEFWDQQLEMTRLLIHRLQAESMPTIVAGDFNTPHLGHIHRSMTQVVQDAHQVAGHGFGLTFPGRILAGGNLPDVNFNLLGMDGPWVRIDYLFASADWQVVSCLTEPKRASQHRAVVAIVRLVEP